MLMCVQLHMKLHQQGQQGQQQLGICSIQFFILNNFRKQIYNIYINSRLKKAIFLKKISNSLSIYSV